MAGQHRTQHGIITQTSTLTNGVKSVLDALDLKPPQAIPGPAPARQSLVTPVPATLTPNEHRQAQVRQFDLT